MPNPPMNDTGGSPKAATKGPRQWAAMVARGKRPIRFATLSALDERYRGAAPIASSSSGVRSRVAKGMCMSSIRAGISSPDVLIRVAIGMFMSSIRAGTSSPDVLIRVPIGMSMLSSSRVPSRVAKGMYTSLYSLRALLRSKANDECRFSRRVEAGVFRRRL